MTPILPVTPTLTLREQLRTCGLSQADICRALGLSPQLVSGVVTGRIKSLPTEIKILKYLYDLQLHDTRTPTL